MYTVYVIQSQKDGRLYVGMTADLETRIKYHNQGRVFSTKRFIPWKLVYTEKVDNRLNARKKEKYFKSGCGKEFIKKVIQLC